jgi:hypothetical protein
MKITIEFVPSVISNRVEKIKNNKNHIDNSIRNITCQYFFYGHSTRKIN